MGLGRMLGDALLFRLGCGAEMAITQRIPPITQLLTCAAWPPAAAPAARHRRQEGQPCQGCTAQAQGQAGGGARRAGRAGRW